MYCTDCVIIIVVALFPLLFSYSAIFTAASVRNKLIHSFIHCVLCPEFVYYIVYYGQYV